MLCIQIALGLESISLVFKCIQCGSSSLIMQLFQLQVTSPRLQLWPSHFFCLGKGFHLLQSFLQHPKTVALVQSGFEFKKGSHFCCCQNWSNQFFKIQKNARIKILKLIEFCTLCFLLQSSLNTFSI